MTELAAEIKKVCRQSPSLACFFAPGRGQLLSKQQLTGNPVIVGMIAETHLRYPERRGLVVHTIAGFPTLWLHITEGKRPITRRGYFLVMRSIIIGMQVLPVAQIEFRPHGPRF